MRKFIRSVGRHLILVRVPVYTSLVLCYWVPEINAYELGRAASKAVHVMNLCIRLHEIASFACSSPQ